ncbi:hypothetical protein L596_020906 [Steinernema carpocapsae]|uniref:Uncharacterized protein n=1 Tax=Steinernema carpocapsae TaxID=34508 RepID=A0A4U5MVN3_STECR|nr:hypothetical protein L596_020906 [Steinernema carpocapsae]
MFLQPLRTFMNRDFCTARFVAGLDASTKKLLRNVIIKINVKDLFFETPPKIKNSGQNSEKNVKTSNM